MPLRSASSIPIKPSLKVPVVHKIVTASKLKILAEILKTPEVETKIATPILAIAIVVAEGMGAEITAVAAAPIGGTRGTATLECSVL